MFYFTKYVKVLTNVKMLTNIIVHILFFIYNSERKYIIKSAAKLPLVMFPNFSLFNFSINFMIKQKIIMSRLQIYKFQNTFYRSKENGLQMFKLYSHNHDFIILDKNLSDITLDINKN